MYRRASLLIALAGLAAGSPAAAGDVSGKLGLASEYLGKGLGKSDEEPALSASVRYSADSGLYGDAFISQAASSRGADSEVILVAGYEAETGDVAFGQLMYREMLNETYDTDGHSHGDRYEGRLVAALTHSF